MAALENNDNNDLSTEMISFLKEQELETEILMTIDAAMEIGIIGFTREDAIHVLLEQEKERNVGNQG